jgi:hypothetical protein
MSFRAFLTRIDRILGSAIELESESFTELSTRAVSPVDHSLIERQKAARAALDAKGIRVRRLIEEQEDMPQRYTLPDEDWS